MKKYSIILKLFYLIFSGAENVLTSTHSGLSVLSSSQGSSAHSNASSDPDYVAPSHLLEVESSTASDQSRGTIDIMTDKLVATLDQCRISGRNATRLIIAIAEALNVDPRLLIVNRTSITEKRAKLRKAKAEKIKNTFDSNALDEIVIHWDGKMLPNLVKRTVTDRLPIVVTNGEIEKLLCVPELENSTGEAQANAIFQALDNWGLTDKVKALSFDTTASNTGPIKGAAVLLEQLLGKELLWLPCRHHIYELVLKSVFTQKLRQLPGQMYLYL